MDSEWQLWFCTLFVAMAANKRGIEAGRAYVKAYLDSSLLMQGLKGLKSHITSFGSALAKIGAVGVGAGLVAAAVGIRKVFSSISETAEIDKISKAFGIATDKASGLFGVFRSNGSENARENIESLVTLSGRVNDALSGTGEQAAKLFDGLSVSAEDLANLPIDEQFFRMHEAIRELPDPLDQINRLMLAFGEDGGKTLIGTLSKSTEELRKQAGALSISKEDAEAASKAQAALNRASATFDRVWVKISTIVAPTIEVIANGLEMLAGKLANGGLSNAMKWVGEQFVWLSGSALDSFKVIKDALLANEFGAAGRVAMAQLHLAFAEGIEQIQTQWVNLKTFLASVFLELSAQVESIWAKLTTIMVKGLTGAAGKSFEILASIAETMGQKGKAAEFRFIAGGLGIAGAVEGNGTQAAIDKRTRQAQEALAEDAERERKAINAGVKEASDELAAAMRDAKEATALATKATDASPLFPGQSVASADDDAKRLKSSLSQSVNEALRVTDAESVNALSRAMNAGLLTSKPTVGEKAIVDAVKESANAINKLVDQGVVLAEGPIV